MKKFNYYLKKLLSWSPILRVTDDSKYNKIEKGSVEFRISFVSFTLGIVSYYFFTWKPKEGSKCFHKLNLYDVQKYNENIRKFEIQYDEYLEELKEKDTTNKKVEKEFLSRRISEIETIKGRTFNKFLAYIALFVFIVPLYISKMTISIPKLTTYNIICVLIMSVFCKKKVHKFAMKNTQACQPSI
ncbi:hypothetical protein [Kurthia zopfii]|uniref:hypothetical protein n=1 Tax=Kurthia zopfii TaxID=1650 RepID=UPI000F6FB3E5|nr:hypothetical protein [Kurthia zopfii]VEI06586.1 Uncharacterised protein [Kurthia zopfii]